MTEWGPAFALTVVLEVPLMTAVIGSGVGWGRAALIAFTAQVLTHPALWFLVPQFTPYLLWVACAETAIVAVETAWLGAWLRREAQPDPWRRAGLAAVLANALSTGVGLALAA